MGVKKVDALIFAYYSYRDPVFQSAVLSYLKRFPIIEGRNFHLITFEHSKYQVDPEKVKEIEAMLKDHNIKWYRSKWRTGFRLKVLFKLMDLIQAFWVCSKIIISQKVTQVYSEGFPGAIIAHLICKLFRLPHVIHTFEPHADYMLDGKVWGKNSWEYRLLKKAERKVANGASDLITGTSAYAEILRSWTDANIHVYPSAIDLNQFNFSEESRTRIRKKMAISRDEIVITYLGKFGGMYMDEEIFEFFAKCEAYDSKFRYWIFSGDGDEEIYKKLEKHKIPKEKLSVQFLNNSQVPEYLSASDIGLVAVRPYPSKRFCSPIKTGEYWACGLPAIIPNGVSDDYLLVKNSIGGLAVSQLEDAIPYLSGLAEVDRQKHRLLAIEYRDIENYAAKISKMLS
jgi:hypothetical protein